MRIAFFFLLIIPIIGIGQELDTAFLKHIKPRSIGPAGMSGRVTCIDVVRDHPEIIYIGTASGGVWKSVNGGVSWKPIFDDQPCLSIGSIAIDPVNHDVIYVGTGEGNPRNSHNSGCGMYKSIDGGRTWKAIGLKKTKILHRIVVHPRHPQIVYAGALGSAWGDSRNRGLYKSKNGGKSWKRILFINDSTGVADMVMDPQNPDKLLVAMWEHRRRPWTFQSGGKGSGLYMTYDGGKNWNRLNHQDGLPKGNLGRMGLAFAPSHPEIVYAFIEAKENGLYRSNDGGHRWKKVGTKNIGNRPFYYADIYVDPANPLRVFSLWSYVSLSEDGGRTFKTIMDYGNNVHPDHHALYIHPDRPNFIINGNDGGLNISYDGGQSWKFSTNIPVGQFYHINYDTAFPYRIYGGMQDNGSWVGPSAVLRRGGIRNHDWQEIYFGDGFDVVPILGDDRYGYAMSQGGNVARYDLHTGKSTTIKPIHPDGEKLRFNWNAAIAIDPFNMDALYFGSQYVHYSRDRGRSWKIISPDLTTNDTTKQKQGESGGLTIDATQAENYTTILAITPSRMDSNTIWVSTDDGLLHRSSDKGSNWTELSDRLPEFPEGAWIPQIIEGADKNEFWIPVNDYRRNNWGAYLYHTRDGGQSFTRVVNDRDIPGFICSVVQDPLDENLVFAGTDVGLYFSIDRGSHWQAWHPNLPPVQIRDLKIQPQTNDLIIGTFGRSVIVIDDISFLRNIQEKNINDQRLKIIHRKDGLLTHSASYRGIRFYAQGEFIGDNRGFAPYIVVSNNPMDSLDQKDKKSKIQVTILNDQRDTIHLYKRKIKSDFQKIGWNMRRSGIRFPSHKERKKDADLPSGIRVGPGKYMIHIQLDSLRDSTELQVFPDPRRKLNEGHLQQQQDAIDSFYQELKKINHAHQSLKDMRSNIKGLQQIWNILPDSTSKELNKLASPLLKKIDSLQHLMIQPQNQKGYRDGSIYLIRDIYTAYHYFQTEDEGYGENVKNAFQVMLKKSQPILEGIQSFMENDWKDFKTSIEERDLPIFKQLEPVEIPK